MTHGALQLPFYIKASIALIGLFFLTYILYITQEILVPVVFSTIIAILLLPVVKFLMRFRIHRVVAIVITLILCIALIAALGGLLVSQMSQLSESWPQLVEKFTLVLNDTITWASGYFDINQKKITEWLVSKKTELINTSSAAVGQTIYMVGNTIIIILLVPTYIFMILYYEPLLHEFIQKLFSDKYKDRVAEIVSQIKTVIQRYLSGLVIEAVLVAILNTSALLLLGIPFAILLGIIGALLNVIPYIGGLIAVALPMMVALATQSSPMYALYVLAAYYFIQLLDNNYIVPVIVASKVKINALFSIIAVIAGNALWGIPGMFLSIPLLAIIKLIFDHIDPLKPFGYLLGDTMPPILKIKPMLKKIKVILHDRH